MMIMAKTMVVMTVAFRTVKHAAFRGRELSCGFFYRPHSAISAPYRAPFHFGHDSQPVSTQLVTVLKRPSRWSTSELVSQATDSTSRSREEITADTPSPRIVTP